MQEPNLQKAEEMAEEVLKQNYAMAQPINIRDIVANYGLKVVEIDYKGHENTRDVAGVIDPERKRIYVEKTDSPARKAFTIAHELGHWLLHQDKLHENKYTVLYRRAIGWYNHEPREHEANYFAACLLVPESLLKEAFKKTQDPKELAQMFDVSDEMMGYRLQEVDGRLDTNVTPNA